MTDRTWRSIAVVLGLVLVFMSGFAIAFVMLPRPAADTAGRSPSPSAGPSIRPSTTPSPTAAPTIEPSEPPASEEPSIEPSGSPGAVANATGTLYAIRLDDPGVSGSRDRVVTFTSAPGTVTVRVTGVKTGRAKVCLQYQKATPTCVTGTNSTVTGKTKRTTTAWTVRLSGVTKGAVTTANLIVTFPATAPQLKLQDFQLGSAAKGPASFRAGASSRADGQAVFAAQWKDQLSYSLKAADVTDTAAAPVDASGGPDTSATVDWPTVAGHKYEVTFAPAEGTTFTARTYFSATLTWP